MKEALDIQIQPFDFAVHPDLGGTKYPYTHEVSPDRTTYTISKENENVSVTLPKNKEFVQVCIENSQGEIFFEAFYDRKGMLAKAYFWLRRYCDRADFFQNSQPEDKILETIHQLYERQADIILEADIESDTLGLYYCTDDSGSEDMGVIESGELGISKELTIINFPPSETDIDFNGESIEQATFFVVLDDKLLRFGFECRKGG